MLTPPNLEALATAGDTTPAEASVTLKKFPLLYELVAEPVWANGLAKGKRRMMLFYEGSLVKLLIGVEKQRIKAIISARCLDDVLAAWEMCLKSNTVPWEQELPEETKAKGKKK